MPPKSSPKKSRAGRKMDALAVHRFWLRKAESVAEQPVSMGGSPHPTVKVGAVLVDKKNRLITASANRFPDGVDRRRPERYQNGRKSLWMNCAEQLALTDALRKRADVRGAKLYVTLEPCAICAGMIAELGLREVFVPVGGLRRYARLKAKWKNSIEIGLIKLAEVGTKLTSIDVKPPRVSRNPNVRKTAREPSADKIAKPALKKLRRNKPVSKKARSKN